MKEASAAPPRAAGRHGNERRPQLGQGHYNLALPTLIDLVIRALARLCPAPSPRAFCDLLDNPLRRQPARYECAVPVQRQRLRRLGCVAGEDGPSVPHDVPRRHALHPHRRQEVELGPSRSTPAGTACPRSASFAADSDLRRATSCTCRACSSRPSTGHNVRPGVSMAAIARFPATSSSFRPTAAQNPR